MRLDGLMPNSSSIVLARTLPIPGNDSKTELTFILPTTLSSALLRASDRDMLPLLSLPRTSARWRRTSSAFLSAACLSEVESVGNGITIPPFYLLNLTTPTIILIRKAVGNRNNKNF
jgi:hypothetical protein